MNDVEAKVLAAKFAYAFFVSARKGLAEGVINDNLQQRHRESVERTLNVNGEFNAFYTMMCNLENLMSNGNENKDPNEIMASTFEEPDDKSWGQDCALKVADYFVSASRGIIPDDVLKGFLPISNPLNERIHLALTMHAPELAELL